MVEFRDNVENITENFSGDLSVVNAARVSFDNWHDEIDEKDVGLLRFLADHNHWTPFAHPQLAFIRQGSTNYFVDWILNSGPGFRRWMIAKTATGYMWLERASLYAYIRTMGHYETDVLYSLIDNYPLSMEAFFPGKVDLEKVVPTTLTTDISSHIYSEKDLQHTLIENGIPVIPPMLAAIGVAHFSFEMPFPIAREWFRHNFDIIRNEVSRRYVDYTPTTFRPNCLRKKSPSAKQGSLAEPIENHDEVMQVFDNSIAHGMGVYEGLIEEGVAPEVARFVLPQAANTKFIETGGIDSYIRIYNQRADADAQMEIRQYAHKVREKLQGDWPKLWANVGDETWKPHELTETNVVDIKPDTGHFET